jgi:pimeloyl-ACP methyl ester carboxylesterase
VHGIQDNAGSFDRLVPLLPRAYYVCIDLPGHGYSSHFPGGFPLDFMDYVLVLIRVLNHFKLDSCYYIGHSLGGVLGLFLHSLWPQKIKKLVLLDALPVMYIETDDFLSHNKRMLDKVLSNEEQFLRKKSPRYTYKEALDRLMTNRIGILTEEAGRTLIKRSLMNSDGGFRFRTDQRLKMGIPVQLNEKQQLQVCTYLTNVSLN